MRQRWPEYQSQQGKEKNGGGHPVKRASAADALIADT